MPSAAPAVSPADWTLSIALGCAQRRCGNDTAAAGLTQSIEQLEQISAAVTFNPAGDLRQLSANAAMGLDEIAAAKRGSFDVVLQQGRRVGRGAYEARVVFLGRRSPGAAPVVLSPLAFAVR